MRSFRYVVADVFTDEPLTGNQLAVFHDGQGLNFTLLADTDHAVAEAWGTWDEKKLYGKTSIGLIRSSFLIDEDGRVQRAWYRVKPDQKVPKAKDALAA